ncbi:2447_t:CDS:2 [Cetraspora pellucida]|uniref:2447_t:CDS:1 n=1 Tax=Cetraspora pellucida TaxID=1433469 RepID=A0ACA9NN48_9GLOM|nr:2447_t:CDS:2 [Cetraspora pellucida]
MRKFFTTISEKELSLLKQARFEKNEQIFIRNNLILDFLFYSGIRVSELVNIKHRDWSDNSLRIQGKGNKVRYVLLPPFLVKYISPGSKGYLFTNQGGRKILTDKVREIIRERTKLAGLKKWVSPHTFRRSFATLLDRKRVRMTTIQKLLGHSNLETTSQYIHNDYESLYADYTLNRKRREKRRLAKSRLATSQISQVGPLEVSQNNQVEPKMANLTTNPKEVSHGKPESKNVEPCPHCPELEKQIQELQKPINPAIEL